MYKYEFPHSFLHERGLLNKHNVIAKLHIRLFLLSLLDLSLNANLCAQACGVNILQPDTTICAGSQLQLNAKNALSYQWFPSTGLSSTTIQNPLCTVDSSITYYFTSTSFSDNLVTNGDFETGNTGFVSTYTYCNSNNCLFPLANNGYSVGTNANFFHTLFSGSDHTTGSGNFMIINGADPSRTVWKETINVTANTTYAFGCWISTMIVLSAAQIRFSINGVQLGSIYNAPNQVNLWNQFYVTWNSGANTSATIEIVDVLPVSNGNDFGLDDIFFGRINSCTDSVRISILKTQVVDKSATLCSGQSYILPSGRVISSTGIYRDTLKNSTGCDSLIDNVTLNVNTVSNENMNLSICAGENYLLPSGRVVKTTGVYHDTLRSATGCDSIITTLTLNVIKVVLRQIDTSLCPGQTYILPSGKIATVTGSYKDTLKSTGGCDSMIVTVNTKVISVQNINLTASLCNGEGYTLASGKVVYTAGTYVDTLRSKKGCDSIITKVTLVIKAPTSSFVIHTTCVGASYVLPSGRVVNQPGIYSDTISNWTGCDSIITTELKNYLALSVQLFGVSIACKGDPVTISATPSGGDSSSYSFQWIPAADNVKFINLLPLASTVVRVVLTDGCASEAMDSLVIAVADKPKASFTFSSRYGCVPLTIHFTNTTLPLQGNSYLWDFGDGSSSGEISPKHDFAKAGLYNISLIAKNTYGCGDTLSVTNAISVSERPVALFNTSPSGNITPNSTIIFTNLSEGSTSWEWDFGDGSGVSSNRTPVYSYKSDGSYLVRLVAFNGNNCTDTAIHKIIIYGKSSFYVPNAFTPNNDGRNDSFRPLVSGNHVSLHFIVFNRWGEKVFETVQLNDGWNGIFHGRNSPAGIYVWICTYQFDGEAQKTQRGTFALLR